MYFSLPQEVLGFFVKGTSSEKWHLNVINNKADNIHLLILLQKHKFGSNITFPLLIDYRYYLGPHCKQFHEVYIYYQCILLANISFAKMRCLLKTNQSRYYGRSIEEIRPYYLVSFVLIVMRVYLHLLSSKYTKNGYS